MTHVTQSQEAVFAFLSDPATHGGIAVKRIDTHGAAVFLAGPRVYKVKRAVRFPFLDYSTPDKRRAACEAELRVNARFAPQIYRRVLAITRAPAGALALGGEGEPVDYALEMHRFDEGATLDRLAERGGIDARLAEKLGHAVADAHRDAPPADAPAWIAALSAYVGQNDDAFREMPDLFPPEEAQALTAASRRSLELVAPLLRARGERGLVRRGHGDLHLGNIVLIDGRPVLFDAIEFDPVVASGDVLYDLAFLLMDLIARELAPMACIVLNRYLAETARAEDLDALAALPLFLSLRAAIRAKVTAAKREHAQPQEKAEIAAGARAYFALAARLIAPPKPVIVAVGGLSGTGKSVLARALAPDLLPLPGAVLLRSDTLRKRLLGLADTDRAPPEAYTAEASAKIYETMIATARRVVSAGHSAVVDAVFAKAEERRALAEAAREAGVAFHGLFLTADLATRIARVGARKGDASDADADVARRQSGYALGLLDWTPVDASGTPEETHARARAALASTQTA
jgi:aminoglycoside phosphotransferase family enzyme/predicted kinase